MSYVLGPLMLTVTEDFRCEGLCAGRSWWHEWERVLPDGRLVTVKTWVYGETRFVRPAFPGSNAWVL